MTFEETALLALAFAAIAWLLWRGFDGKQSEAPAPENRGFNAVQTHH